jgi:tetratricopeptide (TPR) repeat protein
MPGVSDYKRELAAAYIGAGLLAEGDSDYPQAFALLEVGLVQARSINDWRLMCDALNHLGQALRAQGKYDQAHCYYAESLALARDYGDQSLIAHCLKYMGVIVHLQGRLDTAFTLLHEGLGLARAATEQMIVSDILYELGCLARTRGDLKEAQRLLGEAIALAQQVDRSQSPDGCELNELGMIALGEKDYPAARRQIQQGLRLFVAQYAYWGTAFSFENLAIVAAVEEQCWRAYVLTGAAAAARRVTQTASYSHTADQLRAALAALSSRFPQIDAGAAQAAGAQMTLEQAVAYACEES